MSFNTALTGLNAASSELNVVSNNVANASTIGFKKSRAEFADIYATSAMGATNTAVGSGVLLSEVAQQFKQGNMDFTQNTLDMGISGEGFFILHPNKTSDAVVYSRAGAFQVDSDGFVTNSAGQYLQAMPVNSDGTVTSTSLSSSIDLQLPQTAGSPTATSEIEIAANFQSDATVNLPVDFDPTEADSYNSSTSLTSYDSLGNSHITSFYFVKIDGTANVNSEQEAEQVAASYGGYDYTGGSGGGSVADVIGNNLVAPGFADAAALDVYLQGIVPATPPSGVTTAEAATAIWDAWNADSSWAVFSYMDDGSGTLQGVDIAGGIPSGGVGPAYGILSFDTSGVFRSESPTPMDMVPVTPTSGANDMVITLDFANNPSTQFAAPFNTTVLSQDGNTAGRLTGIDIADNGVVRANYSNGSLAALGKIALANFGNPQGLRQIGNTSWEASIDSGVALVGEATSGSFGAIQSGALESSNVDLTAELVQLITAQRNFQANAKAIETASAVTQTIIQMR